MPKFLKIFFVVTSLVVVAALLKNALMGRAYTTTRGVLKVSGIDPADELGRHTYRQLYRIFLSADKVFLTGNADIDTAKAFYNGANDEAAKQGHKSWQFSELENFSDLNTSEFGYLIDKDNFRIGRFDQDTDLSKKTISFYFGTLIHPDDLGDLPAFCEERENLFKFKCVQMRISFKAAEKWSRIRACKKATVDQVEANEYLVLINDKDCA